MALLQKLSFFGLLAILAGCNSTKDETEAIRKVIEDEDIAFYQNKDRSAFASYWHITPDTRWWYSSKDTTEFWTGADFKAAISKMDIPPADNAKCTFSEFFIKVHGNVGWATYNKKTVTSESKTENTHEFRGMEKINGEWKIISASVHTYKPN